MEDTDLPDVKTNTEKDDKNTNFRNHTRDVIHTVKPAMFFENFFGMFRFCEVSGQLLRPSLKMKLFGISISLAYIVVYSTVLKLPAAITSSSKLVDVIEEIPSIVILVQYVTSTMAMLFLFNTANIRIFTIFADLDCMLHINTNRDYYERSRRQTIRYLLTLIITYFVGTLVDLLTETEITITNIVALPMYLVQKLEILVFCKLIVMLQTRLQLINHYLTIFIKEKDNAKDSIFTMCGKKFPEKEFNLIGRISTKNTKVRELALMYDTIGGICSLINEVFNFQIFMTLVFTFTSIVITIWTALFYFQTPTNVPGPLTSVVIWCTTAVLTVVTMSFTCERLLVTRNRTKVFVNKIIMDYDLPNTMRVQAKAFMVLIEAWPLRIFIYDMFSVDITLMLKFISVATTYLIVIIQISHFV